MQNYSITALDYYLLIPVVLTLRAALELENGIRENFIQYTCC